MIEVHEGKLPKGTFKRIPNHNMLGYTSPEYQVWHSMLTRCYYTGKKSHLYKDAGVRVCTRWLTFTNFLEDMGPRPQGTSLNRKGSSLIYSKETCEWASLSVQSRDRNKSKNRTNSKYRGVYYHRRDNLWWAAIVIEGKQRVLGYFKTEIAAAKCYNSFVLTSKIEGARLNEI